MSQNESLGSERALPVRVWDGIVLLFGRSFFPFASVAIILGTILWGPWVSLALAFVLWRIAMRWL
jgi:hypothetical protein